MIPNLKIELRRSATFLSAFNILFAAWNIYLGITVTSRWFMTMGIYYLILCLSRLAVLLFGKGISEPVLLRRVGIMLLLTVLPLFAMVIISNFKAVTDVGTARHEIVMITIALYTFTKITLAVLHLMRTKKRATAVERSLRCISFSDALVSVASLQRSMLLSFGDMPEADIRLFNTLTGIGVCMSVLLLGYALIKKHPRL